VATSSRVVSSALNGSVQQGTADMQQPNREAPEYDVKLQLVVADGGRALALKQS
jgi:hypothetical protein